MSGPTLGLGVTASGIQTVEHLTKALAELETRLRALPAAAGALKDLNKLTAGGSLGSGNDLKKLAGEIKAATQQQATALADLAESIRSGYSKVTSQIDTGGKKAKSSVAAARRELQEEFENMLGTGALFTPQGLRLAERMGVSLLPGQKLALAEAKETWAGVEEYNRAKGAEVAKSVKTAQEQIDAAWAQRKSQTVVKPVAPVAAVFDMVEGKAREKKLDEARGFAAIAKAESEVRAKARLSAAQAEALAVVEADKLLDAARAKAQANNRKVLTEVANKATDFDRALKQANGGRPIENKVSSNDAWRLIEEGRRKEAEKVANETTQAFSRIANAAAAKQANAQKVADEARAAGMVQADAFFAAELKKSSAGRIKAMKEVQAEQERAAGAAATLQVRNARFLAASPTSQARTVLNARAQLDSGVAAPAVRANFGESALAAAQATTLANAYSNVHTKKKEMNDEAARGAPKFKGLAMAMGEAHSAARGLASGFGAMFLTWGSLAPLLAGAALSHATVAIVKLGAEVGHTMDIIKTLGNSTRAEVNGLYADLLTLGRGAFGPTEVAEAMKTLTLAGLSTSQVKSGIRDVLNLAQAGTTDIQTAASTLVAVGTAFGYTASGFNRVSDVITKSAAISMASVESMSAAFKYSTAVAEQYGVSLEETGAVMVSLAQRGIQGTSAGTAFRQMVQELTGQTAKARKILESLGIQAIDVATGKMRPLLDVFSELDGKLGRFNPIARLNVIKDLFNERATKGVSAFWEDFKKGIDVYANSIDRMAGLNKGLAGSAQDTIDILKNQAFAFSALSSVEMSLSPLNQLKSVGNTLKTALVDAFATVEPTVLAAASRIKELLRSGQFKDAIEGLATAVANFSVLVAEHATQIYALAKAYLAWRIAVGTGTLISGLITGFTGVAGSLIGVTAGMKAAEVAALGLGRGGAVAATGLALITKLNPWIAVITGLLTLGAAAWTLFGDKMTAVITAADASKTKLAEFTRGINDEAAALEKVNEQRAKGINLQMAEQIVRQQALVEDARSGFAVKRQAEVAERDRLQSQLTRLENKPEGQRTAGANPAIERLREEVALRNENIKDLYNAENRSVVNNDAAIARMEAASRRSAELNKPQPRTPTGTDDLDTAAKKAEEAAKKLARGQAIVADDMFAGLKSRYEKEEQTIKQAYDHQKKLLDIKHKGMLLSDIEYAIESELVAERSYERQAASFKQFEDAAKKEIEIFDKSKKPGKAIAARAFLENEQAQNSASVTRLKEINAAEEVSNVSKRRIDSDNTLAKLEQEFVQQQKNNQEAVKSLALTEQQRVAQDARLGVEAKYDAVIVEKERTLNELRKSTGYALDIANRDASEENQTRVRMLQARINELLSDIERFKTARDTNSGKAVEQAEKNYTPAWKQTLKDYANHAKMMQELENSFKTSFISTGETIWTEFFKTGKLKLSSLRELIQDTLAKMTYRKFIAEPMERAMDSVWKVVAGSVEKPGEGKAGQPGETSPLQDVLKSLMGPLRQLGAGFEAVITGAFGVERAMDSTSSSFPSMLMRILEAFGGGFASLMRNLALAISSMGGGGGGGILGSIGSFIGSLFGAPVIPMQPGGGYAMGGAFGAGNSIEQYADGGAFTKYAKGASFADGITQFAKGGSFTNQIFNSPTLFKFSKGGTPALGELGEAGPEAVMPLTRGSDGKLGVQASGGSRQVSTTEVKVEIYNNAPNTKARTERGRNGSMKVFIEQLEGELGQRIDNGVGLARNVGGRFALNGGAGLAR